MLRKKLISSHFSTSSIQGPDEAFKKLRFLKPSESPEPDVLFIHEQSNSTICLYSVNSSFSVSSSSYTEVCSSVIEICQYYDSWEKDLHEMIWEGKSFQDLIDRSDDIFQNPVFLSNWQGNVLGYSKSYKESDIRPFWHTVTHESRVPLDTLATLMDSEYRNLLKEENQVHLLSFPDISYRSLFGLIHEDHEIALQFQIIEVSHPLDESDLSLAKNLLEVFRYHYKNMQHTRDGSATDVFRQLIYGAPVKKEELDWALDYLGWSQKDRSFILILIANRDGSCCDKTLYAQMERRVPGCRIIEANSNMIMLLPLEILGEFESEFVHTLDIFHLYAGISLPFQDWSTLSGSYKQAKLINSYCTDDLPCRKSMNFIWDIFLNSLRDENLRQNLIHPAVYTLRSYDKHNQTNLAETLYQYLVCERNKVDTAAALYIHRNTLKYRLDRIDDLLRIDLDDLDTRLHLMISFKLLHNNSSG